MDGRRRGLADVSAIRARLDWLALTQPLRRLLIQGFFGRQDLLRECQFVRHQRDGHASGPVPHRRRQRNGKVDGARETHPRPARIR